MKFRILVKIAEKILKAPLDSEKPRADMYLPVFLLAFGLLLGLAALGCAIAFVVTFALPLIIIVAALALLSVAAVLCWKNQTIRIIDDERFEYTTFLGNKKVYEFRDIKAIRYNSDSTTIILDNGKVHIESMAVMSKQLTEKLNNCAENL